MTNQNFHIIRQSVAAFLGLSLGRWASEGMGRSWLSALIQIAAIAGAMFATSYIAGRVFGKRSSDEPPADEDRPGLGL